MSKFLKIFLLSVFSLVLSVSLVLGYFAWQFVMSGSTDDPSEIVFEVPPGSNMTSVAHALKEKKIIKSVELFLIYAKVKSMNHRIKVGEYAVRATMTPAEVLNVVTSGKSITRALTIAEGLNIYDIGDVIEAGGFGKKEEFLKLVRDPELIQSLLGEKLESLEGYLFPETYRITKYENMRAIVTLMVKRFLLVYQEFAAQQVAMKWTRHQVVTLASIVEKETGAGFERPIISSVFHNRLAKKMRLQTDPTILYGIVDATGEMPQNITKKDILGRTRYNTYTFEGLPPGPIASPGREALLAAIQPVHSNYFYFVSKNNGTHQFSSDLAAHNEAVRVYQLNGRAREGKSWKDLSPDQKANR